MHQPTRHHPPPPSLIAHRIEAARDHSSIVRRRLGAVQKLGKPLKIALRRGAVLHAHLVEVAGALVGAVEAVYSADGPGDVAVVACGGWVG